VYTQGLVKDRAAARDGATVGIQSVGRMFVAKNRYKSRLEARLDLLVYYRRAKDAEAVLTIQSLSRAYLSRRKLATRQEHVANKAQLRDTFAGIRPRDAAAACLLIQTAYRRHRAHCVCESMVLLLRCYTEAKRLQVGGDGTADHIHGDPEDNEDEARQRSLVLKHFGDMIASNDSLTIAHAIGAMSIQALVRGFLARRRVLRRPLTAVPASALRASAASAAAAKGAKESAAFEAASSSSTWRSEANFIHEISAVRIQASYRRYAAKFEWDHREFVVDSSGSSSGVSDSDSDSGLDAAGSSSSEEDSSSDGDDEESKDDSLDGDAGRTSAHGSGRFGGEEAAQAVLKAVVVLQSLARLRQVKAGLIRLEEESVAEFYATVLQAAYRRYSVMSGKSPPRNVQLEAKVLHVAVRQLAGVLHRMSVHNQDASYIINAVCLRDGSRSVATIAHQTLEEAVDQLLDSDSDSGSDVSGGDRNNANGTASDTIPSTIPSHKRTTPTVILPPTTAAVVSATATGQLSATMAAASGFSRHGDGNGVTSFDGSNDSEGTSSTTSSVLEASHITRLAIVACNAVQRIESGRMYFTFGSDALMSTRDSNTLEAAIEERSAAIVQDFWRQARTGDHFT
jgi:hypothetical protein